MPAVSGRQFRFMQAIAHGAKPNKGKGPSKAQAKEYISGQSPKGLPETKKTAIDFPLIGGDKRVVAKKPREFPTKKPKLTTEKLSQLASQQGVQRKIFKKEQEDVESLLKAFERRDDYTLVDPREYYGALQTVSKRVLGWCTDATKGMKVSESRNYPLPVDGALLKVRKVAGDCYSGWVLDKAGDINHLFDRLTLPALASQIMAVYEVYQPEDEHDKTPALRTLQSQVELLNTELKNAKDKSTVKDVEKRIESIINSIEKLTTEHEEARQEHKASVGSISDQLKELKTRLDVHQSPVVSETPSVPDKIEAHQVGTPDKCPDCGQKPCGCYGHLSRPTVEIKPDGHTTILWKSGDWTAQDKVNFLKSMKLVVDRRRGRKAS